MLVPPRTRVSLSSIIYKSLLLPIFVLSSGCLADRTLTQAAYPERITPQVDEEPSPPGPGEGLVYIDSTEGPARVEIREDQMSGAASEGTQGVKINVRKEGYRLLCQTPCAVNLTKGAYDLRFSATGADESLQTWDQIISVGNHPTVVRVTPTQYWQGSTIPFTPLLYTLGLAAVGMGGYMLLSSPNPNDTLEERHSERVVAKSLAIGGASLFGLTIVINYGMSTKKKPGASTTFKLGAAPVPQP